MNRWKGWFESVLGSWDGDDFEDLCKSLKLTASLPLKIKWLEFDNSFLGWSILMGELLVWGRVSHHIMSSHVWSFDIYEKHRSRGFATGDSPWRIFNIFTFTIAMEGDDTMSIWYQWTTNAMCHYQSKVQIGPTKRKNLMEPKVMKVFGDDFLLEGIFQVVSFPRCKFLIRVVNSPCHMSQFCGRTSVSRWISQQWQVRAGIVWAL